MNNLNIAITGSNGRLGYHISKYFQSLSCSVQKVARSEGKEFYSYENFLSNEFLKKTDVILHLAWSSVPKTSEEDFGKEWNNDLPLLVKILQAIEDGNHKHIHIIFFSSAGAIYGKYNKLLATEKELPAPSSMYGWAKLHAEQILQQFTSRHSCKTTILRISNVYGIKSRDNDQQGIIPYIIKAALSEQKLNIWGDGTAQKDYIYITDLLSVLYKIVHQTSTGLFNVSYGKSHSLNDIIHVVERATCKSISISHSDSFPWDNSQSTVDNKKLTSKLLWTPEINLELGIKKVVSQFSITNT